MLILLKMTSANDFRATVHSTHAECIYYDVIPTSAVGYAEGAILGFYPLCVLAVSACVCTCVREHARVCVCACMCVVYLQVFS